MLVRDLELQGLDAALVLEADIGRHLGALSQETQSIAELLLERRSSLRGLTRIELLGLGLVGLLLLGTITMAVVGLLATHLLLGVDNLLCCGGHHCRMCVRVRVTWEWS